MGSIPSPLSFATSQILIALARPGGVSERMRSASIRATSVLTGIPRMLAERLSQSQNNGSRLIDVRWPSMRTEYFFGGW